MIQLESVERKKERLLNEDPQRLLFQSANAPPYRLLLNDAVTHYIKKTKKIIPVHLQIYPTNICNFSCSMCSCSGRDKSLSLKYTDLWQVIQDLGKARKGIYPYLQAVTLSGGGEPLAYLDFQNLINTLNHWDVDIGMATNGTLLTKWPSYLWSKITWCRISSSSEVHRQLASIGMTVEDWLRRIDVAVQTNKNVGWAFSHVLTANSDRTSYDTLAKITKYANENGFDGVRVVTDLVDLKHAPEMSEVKAELKKREIDDHLVIYQDRKAYTRGQNPCYISLLKPVINPDGYLFACCGWQYSLGEKSGHGNDPSMRMGRMEDLMEMVEKQQFWDGRKCAVCYYSQYNIALKYLLSDIRHLGFV